MNGHVCIMTSVHRHDDVRIYHKEAKALREKGFDVTILCPDYEGTDENGIRFVRVLLPKQRMRRILTASGRFYRAAKRTGAQWFRSFWAQGSVFRVLAGQFTTCMRTSRARSSTNRI